MSYSYAPPHSSHTTIALPTKEDVDLVVATAKAALSRNKGVDWASASGSVWARYLRAIAAKVPLFSLLFYFRSFLYFDYSPSLTNHREKA